ncbi:hypothetical protein BD311DRAFT_704566 [Dichomitus squalens]|uniref:Uncharacterized protein n=1 Tax=Dichomitus squalens TaxID=114155 RepID=A0A4Q9M7Y4_9APHY|nr:hypothetical protein BD311DRAFT_704566 [Dichomitus squalens]
MAHDILIGADEDLASQLATEPRGYPNDLFSRHTSPFDPLPLEPKEPLYKRKWFIITNIVVALLSIAILFILLYPVVHAIAQHLVNATVLHVDQAIITNPTNQSFDLSLNAWISHGGIFSATVKFNEPIAVLWTNSKGDQVQLGSFLLDPLTIKNKRAYINETVPFSIDDETAFSQFTSALITEQNFTWHLTSEKVDVRALKFLTAHELKFQKDVALSGMNNFQDEITLVDLQLPRDAPGGGIEFVAVTGIQNPSPFSIDLGTVVFDLSYDGLYLGSGSGYNTTVGSGGNNVTLRGTLVPQNSSDSLSKVSQLFTEYLNAGNPEVLARGRSSFQNDGNAVSWLSSGLTALQLTVPFKAPGPISPIKSISIGDMALVFSEQNAWAPIASSRSVQAELELPFGFNVSIGQLSNSFNITDEGSVVSGLSAPPSASVSQIDVVNSTCTRGTVNITIDDTPLAIPDASHPIFSVFTRNLTNSSSLPFQLEGNARAVANTSIGQLTLDPIIFNVASSLKGLQGLKQLVDIGTVDVIGGSTEAIHLTIPMNIQNPSNLVLSTGDLSLQLFRYGALLGTILIPDMTLQRGNNSFSAQGNFTPNDTPQGMRTLNEFVGGTDVEVAASGYGQSTPIESLVSAFESLNVSASLPALEANLIGSASLSVLDTTSQQNNTVHATVSLTNPFTAELAITHVNSNISFHSISLGTIDAPVAFSSEGNSTTESPALDLALNLDPEALFTVTRICAQSAGLSTDQLDAIVQLGGYQYLDNVNTARHWQMDKRNDVTFIGFNLPTYVDQAFSKLAADVNLQVGVTIGEYPTTLAYTQHNVSVKTDKSLNLLLPILAQPIVQKIVSGTVLGIETILIKDVKQNSFTASLNGSITNAGPFDANITFPMGLDLHWDGVSFGNIAMPDVHVVGNAGANFQVDATVNVTNVDHLTDFTKALLTQDSINWVISGNDLTVSALGILVPGVSLPGKNVTLKGMNNLKGGVKIDSFDLPSNDPAGGIHLTLDTTVANPSQIGIALSSIEFQAFFQNTTIGPVSSSTPFSLLPLSAVSLPLSGRLVPQSSEAGLKAVSALVDGFVHGQDSDVVVQGSGAGATDATWLNEGIKALQVQATLPNQGTLDVITAVTLNELDLRFTDTTAFSPSMSSNDATAAFSLPFGFPVNIISVGQNITAGFGSTDFAQLNIPKGPCSTDVDKRIIHLQISDVPFNVLQGQTSVFEQFLSNTATSVNTTISLKGSADTEVDTAVGVLNLTAIQFNVQTSIAGLQGLTSKPTLVTALDVDHGFSDYLLIKVNSSLFNPSNITLGAGDISFDLTYQNQIIGQADLNDFTILPGNQSYAINVHYQPHGEAVTSGQHLLENFLQGTTSSTTIQGSTNSTLIQSLQLAMSKISLSPVNIPGLGKTLISSTSLVFPPNIAQSGIAQVSFVLANPFTASINLLEISATATYGNLTLGKIDNLNRSNDPIHADGHADVTSPALPFSMNMDPSSIMEFLLAAAQNNDVDLGPLPALFRAALQNPASHSSINATVGNATAPCISGHQFDVNGAILNSLKNLDVTLNVNSSVKIDDYPTDLSFVQKGVRAVTDDTALYLVGVVAPPIVQKFVDQATLSFSQANITNFSDEGFDLSLKGALTGAGPFDAQIVFVEPVSISWQGQTIATISLPPVCMAANIGVPDYKTTAHLTITDTSGFTQFATFLLHNPEFEWTISTGALRAIALGTTFDGVSLSKNISFKAFNNLPDVTISDFKLPSDDPAGGIHIETDSLIPSSADLGIDLGTVAFEASFKGITLGPLSSTNLLLTAHSTTNAHLTGRITPKSGADLAVMGELFTNFLQSQNQTISIRGSSVQPAGANASVAWLSSAFQSLALNITLPGQNLEVIQAIDMSDIELVMTEENQAFAPIASAQNVVAQYKNPFGFSLQVVQSNENITLVSGGIGVAELLLPQTTANGPVSTGNVVPLLLSFDKQTMRALDDAAFSQFMATVTTTSNVDLQLKGSTDVVARTAVGDVPISGIPIDVITSIKGIDSFGHGTVLNNFSITGSGQDNTGPFIKAPLTTALSNPSNISLQTVGVELPVFYQDVMLGRAVIDSLNLQPGDNTVSAEFHYVPQDANDTTAQSFITSFLQTSNKLPLTIKGDASSSPFASLIPALEGVEITTDLKGLNFPPFVTTINAYISAATLFSNTVSIDFDIANPLDTEIQVSFAQADSGLDGVTYVHFEHAFDDFVIPPHATVNSGPINNVLLTQGALGSLKILNSGKVDVFTAATVSIGAYTIPWLHLTTLGAPITVHPSL